MADQLSGAGKEQPDPLIELKKQELQQVAQRDQQRAQGEQQRLAFDQQRENNDMQIDQQRLQQQDQIATERNAVTLAKMNQSGGQNAPRTQ